jgi:hypothetical protein
MRLGPRDVSTYLKGRSKLGSYQGLEVIVNKEIM